MCSLEFLEKVRASEVSDDEEEEEEGKNADKEFWCVGVSSPFESRPARCSVLRAFWAS